MTVFTSQIREQDQPVWMRGGGPIFLGTGCDMPHLHWGGCDRPPKCTPYTRSETNPILVEFRADTYLATVPERAKDYLLYMRQHRTHVQRRFSTAHIDHARKVLERLARFSSHN